MKLTKLDLEILKKAKRAEGGPLLTTEADTGAETMFAWVVTDLAAAQGLLARMFRALLDGEQLEFNGLGLCETCTRNDPEGCTCHYRAAGLSWDGKVICCQDYKRRAAQ